MKIPRILPPIGMLITAAVMFLLSSLKWLAVANFSLPYSHLVISCFVVIALCLDSTALTQFFARKTGIIPFKQPPSSIVTTGIYRFTRNPMYLGMILLLSAWFCYLQNLVAFIPIVLFIAWVQKTYIEKEERILAELFADEFLAYCRQTRRWI